VASVTVTSPVSAREEKTFLIDVLPSMDIVIKVCSTSACEVESKNFVLGETAYFEFELDGELDSAELEVELPDGSKTSVELDSGVELEQTGTYRLSGVLGKAGFKDFVVSESFGVAEKYPLIKEEKELEFELFVCKSDNCTEVVEEFEVGKTVFVGFKSAEEIEVNALIVAPDESIKEVGLPAEFVAELEGEYIVDASASLDGVEGQSILSFVVVGGVLEPGVTEEPGIPWNYIIVGIAVLLIVAGLVLLVLEKKRKDSGEESIQLDF